MKSKTSNIIASMEKLQQTSENIVDETKKYRKSMGVAGHFIRPVRCHGWCFPDIAIYARKWSMVR